MIVGLGNPGPKYAGTRHNLGFMVVNELARRWDMAFDKKKFHSRFAAGAFQGRKVAMLKPSTFMNRSGQAVVDATNFYKLSPADVVIVLDDMALPVGRIRLRQQGSPGGHNGLTDVIDRLGTDRIPRLRLGIGSPPPGIDGVDFVLTRFAADEQPVVQAAIARAADAIELALTKNFHRAMDEYNRTNDTDC